MRISEVGVLGMHILGLKVELRGSSVQDQDLGFEVQGVQWKEFASD